MSNDEVKEKFKEQLYQAWLKEQEQLWNEYKV
jgi:hypothetical protein